MPSPSGFDAGRLTRALVSSDQRAFLASFVPTAKAQGLGERLWENFRDLHVAGLDAPAPGRLRARWSAPGERGTAEDEVGLTLAAGLIADVVAVRPAAPLWLLQRVSVLSAAPAACIAAPGGTDAGAWLRAAADAAAIVQRAGLGTAAAAWDASLVVELPQDDATFATAGGLSASVAFATQAVTVLATADSAPRVQVNTTATASLDDVGRRTLLVHEGVHVATRSALSTAPLWAVEGIAESVAAASDPATRTRNQSLVRASARPTALPSEADLNGPAADTAYAQASAAVDAAIARWGRPAFTGWLADWTTPSRPSDADLTSAYLAAL